MPRLRRLGCRAKRFEPQHIRYPEHRRCDIPVAARPQPHPKLYTDAAPTALDLFLAHGFYRDVAPTALDLCWMRRVLQRCRAYGASFVVGRRVLQRCRAYGARDVVQNDSRTTKMPRLRRFGCQAKRFEPQHIRHPEHRRCDIPVAARPNHTPSSTQMPRLRRSICVGCDGFYRDAAPTGLGVSGKTVRAAAHPAP